MNIDYVNLITIFSVIITVIFLVRTIWEVRKDKKEQEKRVINIKNSMTDYEKILHSTHGLENAREKNKGTHFDNEEVYLNRAKDIRESSSLFDWINER